MFMVNDSMDPTWDILSMANEATSLWTYDETIVVGNSGLAVSFGVIWKAKAKSASQSSILHRGSSTYDV